MFVVEARENPSDFYLFLSIQSPKLRVSALRSVCWDKYVSAHREGLSGGKQVPMYQKAVCPLCCSGHGAGPACCAKPDPLLKKQRSLSYCPTSWLCGVGLLWPHPSCPLPPHLHPPWLPQPPDQSWRLGPVLGSASARPRRGSRSGGPLLFVLMETTRDLGFGLVRQGLERSRGSSGAVACRFNLRSNSISLEQCWLCVG